MLEQNSKKLPFVLYFSQQTAVFYIQIGELLPVNISKV